LSICEWGTAKPWLWGEKAGGNLWRTTGDISDIWQAKDEHHLGVVDILDLQDGLQSYAGPGHWNDPDMLEVGNGGMTTDEYRAHFSLWSILAAPLLAGNDLRDMKPAIHDILTNKEVIAVNQDALGSQGQRVRKDGDLEVWAKQMQDGSRSVVLLNRDTSEKEIGFSWEDIGYPGHVSASVRDLWRAKDLGQHKERFATSVAPHSVVMLRVAP
jgi:alpha-galactosidase